MTRREFATRVAAGAAALPATSRVLGAGDRLRIGYIGVGNRGGQLLAATLPNRDIDVVALCDVYAPVLDEQAARVGGAVRKYSDYRKLLEQKDIDAVFIATPDHWHALQMVDACRAGKDVYVEKPLSITVAEGRKMVEVARQTGRIVQVGLQRRSSAMYANLGKMVQGDEIGKVTVARCYRLNNMWPSGIGRLQDSAPPPGLDWDMWLGPRPKRPFRANIAPYKFRWWKAYSSQVGNWGVHYFDAIRWIVGEVAPASVTALGGRYAVDDDRDIPDTMEAVFEFASGRLLIFGQYEASGVDAMKSGEIELRGTRACIYAGNRGYEVVPEKPGQFQEGGLTPSAASVASADGDIEAGHVRNFLDCVKSRSRPNCDIEEGHRSTVFAHLANIALATKSRIDWDASAERVTNNPRANDLLSYRYRAPWKLE